jgi:hypothetical protein
MVRLEGGLSRSDDGNLVGRDPRPHFGAEAWCSILKFAVVTTILEGHHAVG